MDSQALIIVVAAAVLILIGIGAYAFYSRLRRQRLREQFGPEYERTVAQVGNPTEADSILAKRVERVARFKLRPLSREQVDSFNHEWLRVQALFVDDPDTAVAEADALVARVMETRGYPTKDFESACRRRVGRSPTRGRELPDGPCLDGAPLERRRRDRRAATGRRQLSGALQRLDGCGRHGSSSEGVMTQGRDSAFAKAPADKPAFAKAPADKPAFARPTSL